MKSANLADLQLVMQLGLALGLGLLIGFERGWRQRGEAEGARVAGFRTFALLGLGGGVIGLMFGAVSPWLALFGFAAIITALMLGYRAQLARGESVSATSAIVAVLTLMFGMLATSGHPREAVFAAFATALILSLRDELHQWVRALDARDIKATLQFGVIALVVLPWLPDRALGPYGALNPRQLWLVVVFISGLSFFGYWASKRFGSARGTLMTAAIGASYSSTAVTAELARRMRGTDEPPAVLAAGIAAATAVMPLRVMLLCAILMPRAIGPVLLGIGPAALLAAFLAWRMARRVSHEHGAAVSAINPFTLFPALGFAALIALILIAAHWTMAHIGGAGLLWLIGLTGFFDVDAAIIMASQWPRTLFSPAASGVALTLPILANSLLKTGLVLAIAGWSRARGALVPLLASTLLLALSAATGLILMSSTR